MDKHTLKVDVLKLADVGSELVNASTELENYNTDLYEAVTDLGSGWTGQSYDAFVEMMNRYKKSLESFPALFAAYAGKVDEFDQQGDTLITKVADALKIGVASTYYHQYNVDDNTYNDSQVYVDYEVDWTPESNKEAREQAESVQLNLQADIDVLLQEIRNIDMNIAALESLGPEYASYVEELKLQKQAVEGTLTQYENAKETVDGLLKKSFLGPDGLLIDGFEFWGLKKNDSAASEGTQILRDALSGLPPVSTVVESANINALYAMGSDDDYLARQFYNGTSVSKTMMTAALDVATKNNETESATINGQQVTLFNSKGVVNRGMLDENGNYKYMTDDNSNYTWGQTSAYEDSYGMETTYEGAKGMYDSVVIKTDDNEEIYMTYAQFMERYGEKE